jgi:hypothetical protein
MDVGKIAGLVKRPEADLAAGKSVVNNGKTRLGFIVNEYFDRAGMDVAIYPHLVPILIGQRGSCLDASDAAAGLTIHQENAVVDSHLGPGVNG